MKKRILTIALALLMCLSLIPTTALAAAAVSTVSIKIPGCDAVFTLENVSEDYVITTLNGFPTYRFAFPGNTGKVTCDTSADAVFGDTWEDAEPSNSGAGGGDDSLPGGWSESYPARWLDLNGKGFHTVELAVHDDGTLVGGDKENTAYIAFFFGYPISLMDGKLPEDLISWEWKATTVPGAGAGGPDALEHVNLPKRPVSELAVSSASDSPSSWAAEQVNVAIAAGLVPETLQKNYTQPVSRGDVAQMFVNLIEKSSGQTIDDFLAAKGITINSDAFTDTAEKSVLAANALGIVGGVGDNRFDPKGTLTRAQIAAIINRVARALDVNTEGYTHSFTDVAGHWASSELGWPVHAGVINGVGDNRFDPDGKLTTEQAIVITYRALTADKTQSTPEPSVNTSESASN